LLLGLGTGAVYGALGLGLVLTYRASGVVNFAHGAMAMYATYVYVELRATGDLVLPVVGVGSRLHLADEVPFAAALAVALAVAAAVALAAHVLVFQPLRHAPALGRVVASVGIMVALHAVVALQFGPANRAVAAVLPAEPVHLAGAVIPRDRLLLAAVVVLAGAGLRAGSRWTRLGLATRAAADDEVGAALLGWSPAALAAANWVLAGVLAALAGILVAPITALNPLTYSLLVIPALAAALVGRLSSFGLTVAAGLALGMAQSEVTGLQARYTWLPRTGLQQGLPLLVLVVAMALGTSVVPEAARFAVRRLPRAGRPRRPLVVAAGAAGAGAVLLAATGGQYRLALVTSMIGAVVCLSIVVVTGYGGQISLAQMAFAGTAGFALGPLGHAAGIPFPLAPLLAAGAATVAGLLVGLPALRTRGINLAVLTLAAAVALEELVFKNPGLTGGLRGVSVGTPALFGVRAPPSSLGFGLLVLGVLTATALGVARLRTSPLGRRLLAVRANEEAAAATGVPVTATKLWAFALSALIAGVAGTLLGYQQRRLSFESFGVLSSLSFLAVAYVGGVASIAGALVGGALVAGGVVFTALDRVAGLGRYQLLASGVALTVAAVVAPDGLAGTAARAVRRRARRRGRREAAGEPAEGTAA
jgi:branched-chain amino acid transport system permease protein